MTQRVVLCADVASVQYPETIGLSGENLSAQSWLRIFTSAEEARAFLRTDHQVDEVWVVGSEEVAPINLAATLKRDRPDRCVCLVSFGGTGSLRSRTSAAGIDAFLTRQAFLGRYTQRKQASLVPDCVKAPSTLDAFVQVSPTKDDAKEQAMQSLYADVQTQNSPPLGYQVQGSPSPARQVQNPLVPERQVQNSPSPEFQKSAVFASAQGTTLQKTTPAFLLPVVSGSGGAGKSTIAALCALVSQRQGRRTLLLDFDLQFGDTSTLLGIEDPLTIDELLAAPARVERLQPRDNLPALLAAPKYLEQSEAVVGQAAALLDVLRARFDVIVANTGAGWGEAHAVLLERASRALFLIDQRPSSVHACKHALDVCARCGIASGPFTFAVNRCTKGALFTSIDVSCALGGSHVFELADGGWDVEELLGAGLPAELMSSRNVLCDSVEAMLKELLPTAASSLDPEYAMPERRGLRLRSKQRSRKRARRRKKEEVCLS